MTELIADCASIPTALRAGPAPRQQPRAVGTWTVNEACHAQVADLDEYV
ncbi:hypothetical protein SAMN05216174_102345 [Actinokineospora iranica]|uniref:Uncharacterized protein n=2 Tax=Actinokineospora iranica TaxID=1271860 RepID=A0A1G6M2C3_9PSEU|nr:hypothetical protein SAMN05216174_102345 [Actinokineospora iranica]